MIYPFLQPILSFPEKVSVCVLQVADFEDIVGKLNELSDGVDIEQMKDMADEMERKVDIMDQMLTQYEASIRAPASEFYNFS